jgi:cytochrome oxidase Cu insertion factor (SCO1/SenC/PrrC family)
MLLKVFLTVLVLAAATTAFANQTSGAAGSPPQRKQQQSITYSCPMHPDVKSTKPGVCRKCGMTLRRVADSSTSKTAPDNESTTEKYAFSSAQIPDVQVYDQNGKALNFYSDLIKGNNVAINFIFTTCTNACPLLTATFRRVQVELEKSQTDIKLISVSVDPTVDTPERLREFATKFKTGPGWTFVTGEKTDIDSLLQRFGVGVGNKNQHTSMVLVGNDSADFWTRAYGLSSPSALVQVITNASNRK